MPSVLRSPRGRDAAVRPSGARRRVGPGGGAGGGGTVSLAFILSRTCPVRGTLLRPHIWRCTKTLPPDRSIAEQGADPPERRATSRHF